MKQPTKLIQKSWVLEFIKQASWYHEGLQFGGKEPDEVITLIQNLTPVILKTDLLELSYVCQKLYGCFTHKLIAKANKGLETVITQIKAHSFSEPRNENLIMKTPLRSPNKKTAVDTADVLQVNGNYARFYWAKEEADKGWQFLSFVDLHDFTIIDEANLSDYVIEAVNSVRQIEREDLATLSEEVLNYLKKRNEVIFSYKFGPIMAEREGIIVFNADDMETPLRLKQTRMS